MIDDLRQLVAEEQTYPIDAYLFLYQALDLSQRLAGSRRHVTGRELLDGIRQLAVDLFGPLTLMVMEAWSVRQTGDFGMMVFHLVDRGLMGKTEDDRLEDFDDVYDFAEVFDPTAILADLDWSLGPSFQVGSRAGVVTTSQRVSQT